MVSEIFHTQDKEAKKLTEKERKAQIKKTLEFSKDKQKLLDKLTGKQELQFLKSLVERGLIEVSSAEAIANTDAFEPEQIQEVFDRIDEIDAVEHVDRILPLVMRLTKDEYAQATQDAPARVSALAKLEAALTHLYHQTHTDGFSPMSFFFSAFLMLNKNLVKIQENTIDIKRSLLKTP